MQQSAQQSSSSTAGKGLVNRDTTVQYSSDIRIPNNSYKMSQKLNASAKEKEMCIKISHKHDTSIYT